MTRSGQRHMRIIGVIDIRNGRAVHARAGLRQQYLPVESVSGRSIHLGHVLELARRYVDDLGVRELYVADLDAIMGGRPQDALTKGVAALGVPVWLDAGVASVDRVRRARELGISHVIVGLETLASLDALAQICGTGGDIAFSLDLRNGRPVVGAESVLADMSVDGILDGALAAGVRTTILLDLARVGTGAGIDLALVRHARRRDPGGTIIAGGGIRHRRDLEALAEQGCHGALVATALLTGALTAADVTEVHATPVYFPSTENASSTFPGMKPIEL